MCYRDAIANSTANPNSTSIANARANATAGIANAFTKTNANTDSDATAIVKGRQHYQIPKLCRGQVMHMNKFYG